MNKKYQSPALEVLSFEKEDIVTASLQALNDSDVTAECLEGWF